MKNVIAVLLLLVSSVAFADVADDYIALGGVSYHLKDTNRYNGLNYGIGYEHKVNENWNALVGVYENSIWHKSIYAMGRYTPDSDSRFGGHFLGGRINYMVGAVTGYHVKVAPVLVPAVCWKSVCAFAIPPMGKAIETPVIAFNFRVSLR